MLRQCVIASFVVVAGATAASAQTCEKNFKVSGVPLVTAMSYKSSQSFAKLSVRSKKG